MTLAAEAPLQRRHPSKPLQPGRILSAVVMTLCAAATALPLLLLVDDALRTNGQILRNPVAPPTSLSFKSISDAWSGAGLGQPMGHAFLNSVIVTVCAVTLATSLAALAGYALGTFRFRGADATTQVVLMLVAIPTQALIIPVFKLLEAWNLTNNYLGLILVYTAFWLPLSILLLRASFRDFPRELLEAGRLDRLSELGLLRRIVVPIMRGPIQGVAVINAIGIWSELLFSFLIMNKASSRTLPAAVVAFQGTYSSDYGLLFGALFIAVVPLLVFYAFLSSRIRKGVSSGALK